MLKTNVTRRLFFLAMTAIILATAGVFAENDDSYIQLTRISLIEGNVGYQRVPDEEWAAASANMPFEPGDRIYTGPGGRAEIEFEEGSVLRLAENTDIEFLTLDEKFVQIRMLLGTASIKVEGNVDFEIGTPAAAFSPEINGIYRFEVDDNGRSEAIVRKGRLEAVNNDFTRVIRNGDLIRVYTDEASPTIMAYDRRDAWDEWNDRRDADNRTVSASRRYIPDNVSIGVSELDRHGRWVYVTNYGWGWIPYSVAGGWSPYSVGRWVYRPLFGWTWVSYESWGWLPYHYGRWYRDVRYGWTWFPGESISFRFWSPGLVVFYRGSGWISWGPLGPGDYYDMSYYRYRGRYAGDLFHLRLLAVRQPGNYINRNARGAFQTVSMDHFRGVNSGGPNANMRRNDISQPWKHGSLVRGGLDVSPGRESFRPAPDRRGESSRVEANRPVVVRRTPSQISGNNSRFSQINNPRVSPAPDRSNADRGNNNREGSATDRRSNENSSGSRDRQAAPAERTRPAPETPSAGRDRQGSAADRRPNENSSGGRDRQAAPAERNRPTLETPSAGRNNPGSSSRDSVREDRDRTTGSRPAPAQDNRQPERPNMGNSSSPSRENSPSPERGSPSGNRDRQAAPAERTRPAPEAPSGRRNNQGSSLRDSARETPDRSLAESRPAPAQENPDRSSAESRPAPAQENRQSGQRPNADNASFSRESSSGSRERQAAPAIRENFSGSRERPQAAPATRNQSAPEVSADRRNNQGSSVRDSFAGRQGASGAGQREAQSSRPSGERNSTPSRSGGRR